MRTSQDKNDDIIIFGNKKYIINHETGEFVEVLVDESSTGKERPWRKHKMENQLVEKCYRVLSKEKIEQKKYWEERADRLQACGMHLFFNVYDNNGKEEKKIKYAESCRVRLCPLCSWRRSIKIQVHTRKILEKMQQEAGYAYLLVTLTVPNVSGQELLDKISEMMRAWNRFEGYQKIKKVVKGWYRGLEITHNVNPESKSYDTYHPHFHCIFAVDKNNYFNGRNYIKQAEWLKLWQNAMRDQSITQVDVRKVKPKNQGTDGMISAVCEVAKYTVKSSDYVLPTDWKLSCETVAILDHALVKRRLVAFGGVMKVWHKKLNLDDEIDGNLMEAGDVPNGELVREMCAVWNVGYQQYLISD